MGSKGPFRAKGLQQLIQVVSYLLGKATDNLHMDSVTPGRCAIVPIVHSSKISNEANSQIDMNWLLFTEIASMHRLEPQVVNNLSITCLGFLSRPTTKQSSFIYWS